MKEEKLKDLIKKHTWEEVCKMFVKLYPDQKRNIDGYRKVFNRLKKIKPSRSKLRLELTMCKEPGEKQIWIHVNGIDEKESWAIEFTPWASWLAMEVDKKTTWSFSGLEVICHCLYEMTYCGYEEKTVQNHMKEISSAMKQAMKDHKKKK
ncbi:MAG: hypothetical protein KJI69_05100 [Patescibacteria group bacterium]|nr:hypothetical protein [Patescibacteria group bacterium]